MSWLKSELYEVLRFESELKVLFKYELGKEERSFFEPKLETESRLKT